MSLGLRMGMWAQLLTLCIGGQLVFARNNDLTVASPQDPCSGFVEWRTAQYSTVICLEEAIALGQIDARPGDAIVGAPHASLVRQGMIASLRVALGIPIDVNSACSSDLALLSGISLRVARAIVDHREVHGAYATLDDLLQVKGVGTGLLRRHHQSLFAGRAGAFVSPRPLL